MDKKIINILKSFHINDYEIEDIKQKILKRHDANKHKFNIPIYKK